jgi:methionyl aminopeptidase
MDNKFESMLEANKITLDIIEGCKKLILNAPKITTFEVANYAKMMMSRYQVESAFQGVRGFPNVICISLNSAIIHGLPKEGEYIGKGDVVSLDFGVKVNGYCADAAITFVNAKKPVLPNKKFQLVKDTKQALDDAIKLLQDNFPNCRISDVSIALKKYRKNYGIIEDFGGHGIGKTLHEKNLFIPNVWRKFSKDKILKPGDYFTVEPMFTLGTTETTADKDGFDIKTKDNSLSAHFEYSIAITKEGVIILK